LERDGRSLLEGNFTTLHKENEENQDASVGITDRRNETETQ